ncbi:MAG: hypothetical protein ACI8XX_000245 [Polaribacter sp.]|jgi:hypothetical protein
MTTSTFNRTDYLTPLCMVALYFISSLCLAAESPTALGTALSPSDYVSISIDKVVVDTDGLTQMTNQLSNSIESLSNSIERLSTSETAFDKQDRQALIAATTSVNNASQALSDLSRELPLAVQGLTSELPAALKNTQQQVTTISKSIQTASKAVIHLNDSFPETLVKGKLAIRDITKDVMQQVTLYVGLILLIFALVLAVLMYIVYRTSIQPIASGLSELRAVPEQLSKMSAYMHDTSENLLTLELQQSKGNRRSTVAKSRRGILK